MLTQSIKDNNNTDMYIIVFDLVNWIVLLVLLCINILILTLWIQVAELLERGYL